MSAFGVDSRPGILGYVTAARAYQLWRWEEFAQLVEELADPHLTLAQLSERHGRSESAIKIQVADRLVPAGVRGMDVDSAWEWVRGKLTGEEPYHWEGVLTERRRSAGNELTLPDLHRAVVDGWASQRTLAEIAADTGSTALKVARRLVLLDLAENLQHAAERLGAADPDLQRAIDSECEAERAGRVVILCADLVEEADHGPRRVWSMPVLTAHHDVNGAVARVAAIVEASDGRIDGYVRYHIVESQIDASEQYWAQSDRVPLRKVHRADGLAPEPTAQDENPGEQPRGNVKLRGGQRWSWEEYEQLVTEAADTTLRDDQIAKAHQRTKTAIRMAITARLAPAGVRVAPHDALTWLRTALASGDYDWRSILAKKLSPGVDRPLAGFEQSAGPEAKGDI